MQTKPTWQGPHLTKVQLPLHLPPVPGIRTRLIADQCPRCHGVHLTRESATDCRQATSQREQY